MVKLDNNHWEELITNIIAAIGPDAFIRLCAAVMADEYLQLSYELKGLADEYTRDNDPKEIAEDMVKYGLEFISKQKK